MSLNYSAFSYDDALAHPPTRAGKRPRAALPDTHPAKRPRRVSTPSSAISAVTAASGRSSASSSANPAPPVVASVAAPVPLAPAHPHVLARDDAVVVHHHAHAHAHVHAHGHGHALPLTLPLPLTPPSPPTPAPADDDDDEEDDFDPTLVFASAPPGYDAAASPHADTDDGDDDDDQDEDDEPDSDTDDNPDTGGDALASTAAQVPTETPTPTPAPPTSDTTPGPTLRSDAAIAADAANSFCTGQTGLVQWTNELLVHVLATDVEDLCAANAHARAAGRTGSPVSDAGSDDGASTRTSARSATTGCDDGTGGNAGELHVFFSQHKQPFELDFYMRRLIQFANCSSAAFIVMLVYLDRVQQRCPALLLSDMNCHRLLCTALVLAIKYLDDEVFSNAYYARVGGVTADEMNDLELRMLDILRWDLSVKPDTFALYEEGLVRSAALVADPPASD